MKDNSIDTRLKCDKYESYKDSGVAWIGEIPSEWKIVRHKNVFSCNKELVGDNWNKTQLLSLTTKGIKNVNIGTTSGKVPDSYDTYQMVQIGNIVMCLFDLDCSAVFSGLCNTKGMISPAYKVLTVCNDNNPQYYSYWFDYIFVGRKFMFLSKNIRYSLTYDEFSALCIPQPSLEIQQRIASFLDSKCADIDALVSLQEEMIEELKAYKQSVITEAVTKGLDKNAKMKDSGVEWIGEIPEDWEVRRLKYVVDSFKKGSGITKDDVIENGDTECVRYGEIYSKYNNHFSTCISKTNKNKIVPQQFFNYGDILFAGTGELVEEIGKNIVYLGCEKCLAGGDIIIVKHSQNPSFLNYALNSHYAQAQKSCGKAKLKVVHISSSDISNIIIVYPDILSQRSIASYLDEKTSQIDELIALKNKKIEELKEYKKSVIFEYVTGKKKV